MTATDDRLSPKVSNELVFNGKLEYSVYHYYCVVFVVTALNWYPQHLQLFCKLPVFPQTTVP